MAICLQKEKRVLKICFVFTELLLIKRATRQTQFAVAGVYSLSISVDEIKIVILYMPWV